MKKYQIPTAEYHHFDNYDEASQYLDSINHRVVIKADGLAAGKGVVLPRKKEEAQDFLRNIMVEAKFGPAGQSVVIEDFMVGDEISVLTFSDGKTFKSLPPGQDHKRVFEGGRGPNTGGMGVYAPVDFVSQGQMREINQKILRPTFDGLKAEGEQKKPSSCEQIQVLMFSIGRTFVGLLFTGIMITPSGEPKVLEYNARFGDPETQTMMLLLANQDLATILLSCVAGELDGTDIQARAGYACNVVVAAGGYPNSYRSGDEISVDPNAHLENSSTALQVFHAGTKLVDGKLVTSGGRVLSVAAYAPTLQGALDSAYTGTKNIQFNNMHFRKDIAARVMQK